MQDSKGKDISDLIYQQKREVINRLVLSNGNILAWPDCIEITGTLFEHTNKFKEGYFFK